MMGVSFPFVLVPSITADFEDSIGTQTSSVQNSVIDNGIELLNKKQTVIHYSFLSFSVWQLSPGGVVVREG